MLETNNIKTTKAMWFSFCKLRSRCSSSFGGGSERNQSRTRRAARSDPLRLPHGPKLQNAPPTSPGPCGHWFTVNFLQKTTWIYSFSTLEIWKQWNQAICRNDCEEILTVVQRIRSRLLQGADAHPSIHSSMTRWRALWRTHFYKCGSRSRNPPHWGANKDYKAPAVRVKTWWILHRQK